MICNDPKVVQKLHSNPTTPNTTGYGYKTVRRWKQPFQRNTRVYTVASLKKNTDQYIIEPIFI
jgi:hypothetical protein